MSNRALLFTTGSPFSRIVRVVLDELGLDYERREEITNPTSESRAESTPTLQVPTFWGGDAHLWESSLNVEYLLTNDEAPKEGNPPLAKSLARDESHWHDRLIASSIHTPGTSAGEGFQPDLLSIQDIALGCHFGYILNRPIGIDLKLDNFPKIQSLLNFLTDRGSFIDNPILWWEPGVVGYAEDGLTPIYKNG